MLNSDNLVVRVTAEKSLKLYMQKRKVKETEQEHNFAGYEFDENDLVVKNIRIMFEQIFLNWTYWHFAQNLFSTSICLCY